MSAELLGVLVALVALISGWLLGRSSQRIANQHYHVDASALVHEWSGDLRAWASEAIDVLSEASYLSAFAIGREFSAQNLLRCRYRLSALIDRGRFFLPNQRSGDMDMAKPLAFRGIRHSVLDPLVAAERVLGGDKGSFESPGDALIAMRREFVSAIQQILAPHTQNEDIAALIRAHHGARKDDATLGGLLQDEDSTPVGSDILLADAAERQTWQPIGTNVPS
jgi:hypothetical protein